LQDELPLPELSRHRQTVRRGPDPAAKPDHRPTNNESAPHGPEAKTIKNRVHLDPTTGADDRAGEIERLLQLGARRVDIGQTGAESWTVLADPEGNEFCVVRPKRTQVD
jgi:hypothetical protein